MSDEDQTRFRRRLDEVQNKLGYFCLLYYLMFLKRKKGGGAVGGAGAGEQAMKTLASTLENFPDIAKERIMAIG